MPDTYMNQGRSARQRLAKNFAEDAADGLLTEASLAADYAARLVAILRGAGCGAISTGALKKALTDCFGDCQGAINRALDGEGLEIDRHQLDLTEVEGA